MRRYVEITNLPFSFPDYAFACYLIFFSILVNGRMLHVLSRKKNYYFLFCVEFISTFCIHSYEYFSSIFKKYLFLILQMKRFCKNQQDVSICQGFVLMFNTFNILPGHPIYRGRKSSSLLVFNSPTDWRCGTGGTVSNLKNLEDLKKCYHRPLFL